MPVMAASKFERFFREVAGLDVDKNDLKRFNDFIDRKLRDLMVVANATATANRRDVVEVWDLPLTKGLRLSIRDFEDLDRVLQLQPILEVLAIPRGDRPLSAEADAKLPSIVGGLSVALGRSFKIIDPVLTNPSSAHWERAFRLFDLLL